jgi:hypothetical protein
MLCRGEVKNWRCWRTGLIGTWHLQSLLHHIDVGGKTLDGKCCSVASTLAHEAYHLAGAGEPEAYKLEKDCFNFWHGSPASKAIEAKMKKCIFLLLVCFASSAMWAKCGNSAIVIDGSISGSVTGSTISVQVVPDPNWDSQPSAIVDANGQFHMNVYFDRTQPGNRERCSRKPKQSQFS